MGVVFVYITNPDSRTANKVARHLLKKRLAACAHIFPISSTYWWKGRIVKEKEFVLIAKTRKELYGKMKKEVEKIHPYKIPCVAMIPVSANEKFARWLADETRQK